MTYTHDDMLAAVERSPAAAGAHDRAAWLALFTDNAVLEDPVGSRPHQGHASIGRFYDAFIDPCNVVFRPDADIVVGTTVIRDLERTITITPGVGLNAPAYLRYDLEPIGGELKISRLQAFWELPVMLATFMRGGVKSVPAGGRLSLALLSSQGFGGAAAFVGGIRGVRVPGKQRVEQLLRDVCTGDEVAVRRRLARGTSVTIGDSVPLGMSGLVDRLRGARFRKVIASGRHVAAGIEHDHARGVLIVDMEPKSLRIDRLRYFESPRHEGYTPDSAGLR